MRIPSALVAILVTALSGALVAPLAQADLDGLLNRVLSDQSQDSIEEQNREAKFILAKDFQQKLLNEAKAELASLEKKTAQLSQTFERNEKDLTILENKLAQASGTLGEMFGVVKQISGDLSSQLETSIVSAELKGRQNFVRTLASRKALPNSAELKQLWHEILTETIESGKVSSFKGTVIGTDGRPSEETITRIGAFNLVAGGKYLSFLPETSQIVELPRQPARKHLASIDDLESAVAKDTEVQFSIDPSRGALLGMLVNAPSLAERFHQGGFVGYVITLLLLVGVAIVGERFFFLRREKQKVLEQLKSDQIDESNSLGRLMKVFRDHQNEPIDSLELKLNESILKSLPQLERGIGGLKLLAGIGPLMGLLGTVTGMITTFQSITMFGTGDPKLMAGGISTALVTTVQGLICAIPMLLMHAFISSRSKEVVQILTEQSVGLIAEKAGR